MPRTSPPAARRPIRPADVVVTSGSQQALDLVARALLDPGDAVVVEDPAYVGALQVFQAAGAELTGVPLDADGMRVDVLADRLAAGLRPRLVHTVSSFHNPRGVTLAPDRRRALAALADRYGFLVVEDDPYGLLAFDGAPAQPVAAYGDRVLRLGSASKIVAPALRVGWLTGPAAVIAAVERLKQGTDLCGSSLTQAIAAELLADAGWLDAHLTTHPRGHGGAGRAFTAAVADLLPDVACTTPTGGMFCWLEFPPGDVDTTELLPAGARRGRGASSRARRSPCTPTRPARPGAASPRSTRPRSPRRSRGSPRASPRVLSVRQILELLERDATLTPDTLATMTGLPVDEVRAQIAAWERSGAIRRYRAVVDWDAVDDDPTRETVTAFIDVSIAPARGVGFDDVAVRIARFAEVRSVYLVSGSQDLRCTVTGPTIRAVSDFVSQKLSTIDRVRSTATHFVLKTYKRDGDAFETARARPPAAGDAVKPLNDVIAACPPSGIRKFFDIAAERDDVISLGVGEPDFVTPWRVREAGIYALEHGYTTYTSNAGLPRLRELICADLERALRHRLRVDRRVPDHHRRLGGPGPGAAGAAQPRRRGDRPGALLRRLRAVHRVRGRRAGAGADALRRTGSPSTPPSWRPRSPRAPRRCCSARPPTRPARCSPAPRWRRSSGSPSATTSTWSPTRSTTASPTTPRTPASARSRPDRTVLLGGFSKAHAMTGWRVGWICAPRAVAELCVRVHQYTMLCAPHVSQMAAVEALSGPDDDVAAMVADYDRRRRVFVKGLREIGLDCPEPGGAFYAFPSIRASGMDSATFAEKLLHAEGVAVVPGNVFGPSGEGHVRCSYATALPLLEEALTRMDRFLRSDHRESDGQ